MQLQQDMRIGKLEFYVIFCFLFLLFKLSKSNDVLEPRTRQF